MMVGGEIRIEDIVKVECTRYEWYFGDNDITEEIIFRLENGKMFVISGGDGFFKQLYEAIDNHELFATKFGKMEAL